MTTKPCPKCGKPMEWVPTGWGKRADGSLAEVGFWMCVNPECGG